MVWLHWSWDSDFNWCDLDFSFVILNKLENTKLA